MPTRITRSYSRRGLFGGRVRYTTSHVVGQRAYSPAQLAQMAAAEDDMRRRDAVIQAQHMASLNRAQRWLHTRIGAGVTLALFIIGLALALALDWSYLLVAETIVLAVVDWRNLSTLHGHIPWRAWRVGGHNSLRIWTGVSLWLLGIMFLPAVYGIQAWLAAPALASADHEQLRAHIAALEAEVLPAASRQPDSHHIHD